MASDTLTVGKIGETFAKQFLLSRNYHILGHHITSHWGELDFVAQDGDKIRFIEVKTRVGTKKGKPYESVGFYKIKSLKRAVQMYIQKNNLQKYKHSLDVVSIVLDSSYKLCDLTFFENVA